VVLERPGRREVPTRACLAVRVTLAERLEVPTRAWLAGCKKIKKKVEEKKTNFG
jgi:hypothetical protein